MGSPRSAKTIRGRPPYLSRFNIGPRLTACFLLIISFFVVGRVLLVYQLYLLRKQADRLVAVDQELIAVLRFQTGLHGFYNRLNDLAEAENKDELLAETETLRKSLDQDTKRTEEFFRRAPSGTKLNSLVFPTIESVQSALPSQLEAISGLAKSGDWVAIRQRLLYQVRPLEILSSDLVKSVDEEVAGERGGGGGNIAQAQSRMLPIF